MKWDITDPEAIKTLVALGGLQAGDTIKFLAECGNPRVRRRVAVVERLVLSAPEWRIYTKMRSGTGIWASGEEFIAWKRGKR